MNNDITRYIQYVEVSNGDACIVLDDGSILGGVYSVSTSSTAGTHSYAIINAYIINESTMLNDLIKKHNKK